MDQNGKQTIKRIKQIKNADGTTAIEEFQDEQGNLQILRKTRVKDEHGKEILVEENLSKEGHVLKTVKKLVNISGNQETIEEVVNSEGKKAVKKTRVIKNNDGTLNIIEE